MHKRRVGVYLAVTLLAACAQNPKADSDAAGHGSGGEDAGNLALALLETYQQPEEELEALSLQDGFYASQGRAGPRRQSWGDLAQSTVEKARQMYRDAFQPPRAPGRGAARRPQAEAEPTYASRPSGGGTATRPQAEAEPTYASRPPGRGAANYPQAEAEPTYAPAPRTKPGQKRPSTTPPRPREEIVAEHEPRPGRTREGYIAPPPRKPNTPPAIDAATGCPVPSAASLGPDVRVIFDLGKSNGQVAIYKEPSTSSAVTKVQSCLMVHVVCKDKKVERNGNLVHVKMDKESSVEGWIAGENLRYTIPPSEKCPKIEAESGPITAE